MTTAPHAPALAAAPALNGLARSRLLSSLVHGTAGVDDAHLREAVTGRVVMVTGASFGIGEATATRLAAAGAVVLLVARSVDALQAVAERINARGGRAHAHPCDLTDEQQVTALVATVLERHGCVDVLVNNAGRSIRRTVEQSLDRPHDFRRTMEINYHGPVTLTLGLLPAMLARGEGHLVNVSTIAVRIGPSPRWAAYQASKGAFDIWSRSVAQEIRGRGVTTSTVDMGLVRTRMSAPTRHYRHVPALTPQDAADIVCAAVARRPRYLTPWWCLPAGLGASVLRVPSEAAGAGLFRLSRRPRPQGRPVP